MNDAFTLNQYPCGCSVVSELRGGLGAKTIARCQLHKHAELLLKAVARVHAAFTEGRNPTFDAIDKLTTAIAACTLDLRVTNVPADGPQQSVDTNAECYPAHRDFAPACVPVKRGTLFSREQLHQHCPECGGCYDCTHIPANAPQEPTCAYVFVRGGTMTRGGRVGGTCGLPKSDGIHERQHPFVPVTVVESSVLPSKSEPTHCIHCGALSDWCAAGRGCCPRCSHASVKDGETRS